MFTKYTKKIISEGHAFAGMKAEEYVTSVLTPGSEFELLTQVRHLKPGIYTVVSYNDTGDEHTPSIFVDPNLAGGPRKTDGILVLKQTGKPQILNLSIKQNNYRFIQNQITYPKIAKALKNYPNSSYVKALVKTIKKAVAVVKAVKHATYFDLDDSTPGKIIGIDINYRKGKLTRGSTSKSFDYYLDHDDPTEKFLIYGALTGEGLNPMEDTKIGYMLLVKVTNNKILVEPNVKINGELTHLELTTTKQIMNKVAKEEKGNFTISFRHFKSKNKNASLENILDIDI